MPYEFTKELKEGRKEEADQHEQSENHLRMAENAYLELSSVYKWKTIECVRERIKTVDEIHEEIYTYIKGMLEP